MIEKQIEKINEDLKEQRQYLKNMKNPYECDAIKLRNFDLIPQYETNIKVLERERAKLRYRLKKLERKPKVKVVLV